MIDVHKNTTGQTIFYLTTKTVSLVLLVTESGIVLTPYWGAGLPRRIFPMLPAKSPAPAIWRTRTARRISSWNSCPKFIPPMATPTCGVRPSLFYMRTAPAPPTCAMRPTAHTAEKRSWTACPPSVPPRTVRRWSCGWRTLCSPWRPCCASASLKAMTPSRNPCGWRTSTRPNRYAWKNCAPQIST